VDDMQRFYDLGLMEQEGSGYDRMYATLLAVGKQPPCVDEGTDRVCVTVAGRAMNSETIGFMSRVSQAYPLRQKELIALGLLMQHGSLTALEFSALLELEGRSERLRDWLGRLPEWGLVRSRGRTRGKEYRVDPAVVHRVGYEGRTTLKGIEPHRLSGLIMEDLRLHPASAISDLQRRVGSEIALSKLRRALNALVAGGTVCRCGVNRWTRYSISQDTGK